MINGHHEVSDAVEDALRSFIHKTDGNLPPGFYMRVIREVEKPLIQLCLERTGGNQLKAAQILGINRNTLRKKIRYLGLSDEP